MFNSRCVRAPCLLCHVDDDAICCWTGFETAKAVSNREILAGRIDLLPFLPEQAISITAHRFGTPNQLSDSLI